MVWKCFPLNLHNCSNSWKWKYDMVKSPCIGKCTYDIMIQKCNDCNRTKEQISTWYIMTDDEKLAVLEQLLKEQK